MATIATRLRLLPSDRLAVWGDGFAGDDWAMTAAVQSWDSLSADEYARFHPRLAARDDGHPSPGLVAALADALAAWLWHLRQGAGDWTQGLAALSPDEVEERGPGAYAVRFAPHRHSIWRWHPDVATAPEAPSMAAGLRLMDRTLTWCRSEPARDPPPPAGGRFALFAYLSGLHPASIWPAAMGRHERDATAAWLGIVARGRAALMPIDVADYLSDIIRTKDGPGVIHDAELAPLIRPWIDPLRLASAAGRRRDGRLDPIDRRALARTTAGARWSAQRQPPQALGDWLMLGGTGATESGE